MEIKAGSRWKRVGNQVRHIQPGDIFVVNYLDGASYYLTRESDGRKYSTGKSYLWDPTRWEYIPATPEEQVSLWVDKVRAS